MCNKYHQSSKPASSRNITKIEKAALTNYFHKYLDVSHIFWCHLWLPSLLIWSKKYNIFQSCQIWPSLSNFVKNDQNWQILSKLLNLVKSAMCLHRKVSKMSDTEVCWNQIYKPYCNSFSSVVTVTSKATKSSDGIHRLLVNAKHALTIDLPLLLCHQMSKGVFIRGNDWGASVLAKDN